MVLKTMSYGSPEMFSELETVANPKVAALLSALVPGLGQLVMREWVKGGVIAGLWLLSLISIKLMPNGVQSLQDLMAFQFSAKTFNAAVLVPIGFCLVLLIGAVADLSFRAKTFMPKHIERPKPPENLPFE